MRAVLLLAGKDLRLLARDRVAAFFTLIFPIIFGVAFGFIFRGAVTGQAASSAVGFVDEDSSELSTALASALRARDVELVDLEGQDATALIRSGELAAVIVAEDGFGDQPDGVFQGEPVRAVLIVDPSKGAEAAMVEGHLTAALFEVFANAMREPDRLQRLAGRDGVPAAARAQLAMAANAIRNTEDDSGGAGGFAPVRVERSVLSVDEGDGDTRLLSAFELTFPQSAAWALVGCVTGFGISLAHERSQGTLGRVLAGPVRPGVVLAGKAVACFVCALAVLATIRGVFALPIFGVRGGVWWIEASVFAACAFAFTGVMMMLAGIARGERGAEGLVRATLLLLALLGGAGVPLVFFTGWMRTVTAASPFRWAIEAIEGATWRGWPADQLAVPILVLMGIGVCGLVVGSLLISRRTAT